jgi:hypothetical protein
MQFNLFGQQQFQQKRLHNISRDMTPAAQFVNRNRIM